MLRFLVDVCWYMYVRRKCVRQTRERKQKNTDYESLLISQLFSGVNESRKEEKKKEIATTTTTTTTIKKNCVLEMWVV